MRISLLLSLCMTLLIHGCNELDDIENLNRATVLRLDESMDAIDSSLWAAADWANGDPFYNGWCPEQISFANSTMQISLIQSACNNKTHASGEYRTVSTYGYGRYEVRMKASNVTGTMSTFFTYTGSAEGTQHDEIDFEIFGKDPTTLQVNYWTNDVEHPTTLNLGFDASAAYHTYAFEWRAGSIKWYIDDVLVHTEDGSRGALPTTASKIMLNLWACTGIDSWCGAYTDNTPATAQYDYVKYWEY